MESSIEAGHSQTPNSLLDLFLGSLIGLLFIFPLFIFAYTGYFNRLMVDDYMTLNALHANGFWGSQSFWYFGWSGRFSFTFLMNLVELGETSFFPYVPVVVLAAWLGVFGWAFYEGFKILDARRPVLLASFCSIVTVALTLMIVPNVYQLAFWVTGVLTYEIPLVFMAWIAAVILHEYRKRPNMPARITTLALVFTLALICGGFSETSLAFQVVLSGLVTFAIFITIPKEKRGPLFYLALSTLAGSLISLAVVGLAPGNGVRAGSIEQKGLFWSLSATLQSVNFYLIKALLVRKRLQFALSLIASILFGLLLLDIPALRNIRFSWKNIFLIVFLPAVIVIFLAYTCYFPAYLILANGPPERATVIGMFPEALVWVAWGLIIGQFTRQYIQRRLDPDVFRVLTRAFIFFAWIGLFAMFIPRYEGFLKIAADAQAYAAAWDIRDQEIRQDIQAGQTRVETTILWREGDMSDLTTDPTFQMNQVIAEYYGLEQIIAQ